MQLTPLLSLLFLIIISMSAMPTKLPTSSKYWLKAAGDATALAELETLLGTKALSENSASK